jgi:YbgC/YbaW family acyl-CoA thioester hydrolase
MPTEPETQQEPFRLRLFARWPDMDFMQHMRNAAYLGASEDCRMHFLTANGFSMDTLRARQLGPVVVEDKLTYKRELKLLEPFVVELALAAITRDGRRMNVRNTLVREDGSVAAIVESIVLWFDIAARKPVVPPDDLRDAWMKLARTSDFAWLD